MTTGTRILNALNGGEQKKLVCLWMDLTPLTIHATRC